MKSNYLIDSKTDEMNLVEVDVNLDEVNGNGSRRKQKNYFDKFLGLMMRKTGSDERMLIYGNDPFR